MSLVGGEELAFRADFAVSVENAVAFHCGLVHSENILAICGSGGQEVGSVLNGSSSVNQNGECFGNDGFATSQCCGNGNIDCFFGKGNDEFAVFNNNAIVIRSPTDENAFIGNAVNGQNDFAAFGDVFSQSEVFFFVFNFFCIGSFRDTNILKCISINGSQIEFTVEQADNAGNVCNPTGVFGVRSDESSLFCLRNGANGAGDSHVGNEIAHLELVVTVGNVSVLRKNGNAIDGNQLRLLFGDGSIAKRSSVFVEFGVVVNNEFFFFSVKDFSCSIFQFMSTAVNGLGTGNFKSHTNFDACFSGINVVSHAVDVVAAVVVLQVHTVVGSALRLAEDSGNNAANNCRIAFSCCDVICPRHNCVCRNGVFCKAYRNSVAFSVRNGSGQNVLHVNAGLFVYVDFHFVGLVAGFDDNVVSFALKNFNGPFNRVLYAFRRDGVQSDDVGSSGGGFVFVHCVQERLCVFQGGCSGFGGGGGTFTAADLAGCQCHNQEQSYDQAR